MTNVHKFNQLTSQNRPDSFTDPTIIDFPQLLYSYLWALN